MASSKSNAENEQRYNVVLKNNIPLDELPHNDDFTLVDKGNNVIEWCNVDMRHGITVNTTVEQLVKFIRNRTKVSMRNIIYTKDNDKITIIGLTSNNEFVRLCIYDEVKKCEIKYPYDNDSEQSMIEAFEEAFNTISKFKSDQLK